MIAIEYTCSIVATNSGYGANMQSHLANDERQLSKSRQLHYAVALAALLCLLYAADARAGDLRSVFMEQLTGEELRSAIASGYNRVLLCSGSVEASGPHLALGKHNIRVHNYAEQIARQLDRTLVAPIIPVAPTGGKLQRFAGTINVPTHIFAELNAQIARSLVASGFKYIILLGDHGGSQEPLEEIARRLDSEVKRKGIRVFFCGDVYTKSTREIEDSAKALGLDAGGHGGVWDTSELWAVDSSAVRPDRLTLAGSNDSAADAVVVTGDPSHASPELGKVFIAIRIRNAVSQIRALLAEAKD